MLLGEKKENNSVLKPGMNLYYALRNGMNPFHMIPEYIFNKNNALIK